MPNATHPAPVNVDAESTAVTVNPATEGIRALFGGLRTTATNADMHDVDDIDSDNHHGEGIDRTSPFAAAPAPAAPALAVSAAPEEGHLGVLAPAAPTDAPPPGSFPQDVVAAATADLHS